jgi:hypothetical protein
MLRAAGMSLEIRDRPVAPVDLPAPRLRFEKGLRPARPSARALAASGLAAVCVVLGGRAWSSQPEAITAQVRGAGGHAAPHGSPADGPWGPPWLIGACGIGSRVSSPARTSQGARRSAAA